MLIRLYLVILIDIIFCQCSIEAIYLNSCARWNKTGITLIGENSSTDNQLKSPQGMFLHQDSNILFVADTGNRRIQMFSLNETSITGVTILSNIDSLSAIYIDGNQEDGFIIYAALRYENRVEKWITSASIGERIGNQCKQCTGVWLDKDKNVYMTESGTHSILKWSPTTNTSTTVAGRTDEQGNTDDHLYFPRGIYFDELTDALYVTDTMNNRIQRWNKNSQKGVTVAGSKEGISGYDASKLSSPLNVWIDDRSDIVYVVDTDNDRIQRWLPNQSTGTTIVGGTGRGNSSNQFSMPNALTFDKLGNLYVCDGNNHRIQMFPLIDNQTCTTSHSNSFLFESNIKYINVFILLTFIHQFFI